MKFGRSSNPVLSKKMFLNRTYDDAYSETMTLNGTINKTIILTLLVIVSGTLTWKMAFSGAVTTGWILFGAIGGLIAAIVTSFKPQWAPITAPIYALLEGLALGAISAMYAMVMSGIVVKAVLLTFAILFTMLFIYRTGIIKVTEKFKAGLSMAIGGVFIFYIAQWILGMFGIQLVAFHEGGTLAIIISLAIVVIASLVLLWDFNMIEEGVQSGAPKFMEWYGGFSLLVTLVWLYVELLRLLAMLSGRD